jgi:hypothetical protein
MKAEALFSNVLARAIKVRFKIFFIPAVIYFSFNGLLAGATDTIVTVRYNNPEYVCATQSYSLDVEFQCNVANMQVHGMNVRFYYNDEILEFTSFGEFVTGYAATSPNPPLVTTGTETEGMNYFGITGPQEYINGAIKKTTTIYNTILPTTTWVKLFNVNFHVDDPESLKDSSFCPSVIWDLEEDPSQGGFIGEGGGVVITLVKTFPNLTYSCTENVQQFNWQYDGVPGIPFGNPIETNCISTLSTYAPKSSIPFIGMSSPGPVSVPITVDDFTNIKSFSLIIKYYPTAITFLGGTPNPIFNASNGLLTITDAVAAGGMRKVTLVFNGNNIISLPLNSVLATINFNYIGGETCLDWLTNSSGCVYYGPNNVLKCDQPYPDYFINGGIISSLAPITKIDSAVCLAGDFATFTIRTWNFNDIHSGSLTLNYDPLVLMYEETLPNMAIADTFSVDASVPGSLEMSFTGADTSLADGSELMFVTFEYLGGSSPVTWFDDGSSCQYYHSLLSDPLTDAPQGTFYLNGNITNSVFVWGGDNSNDWNSEANWPNNTLPDQFTNVTLDPAADPSFWPTFEGDFTLGEDCKNLTLYGAAQLIINGDLVINPGHTLNIGSGIIKVYGDWINSGLFVPGTGTVEFTGDTDVIIDEGVPPGNFVAAYVLCGFSPGYTAISGGIAGPSGDNAHSDVNLGFSFTYLGTSYSQVRINTNGWLSLDLSGTDAASSDNTLLFNTSAPSTALSPWWDDLVADASSTISYLTEGASPNKIFTAEWSNILAFSSGASARLNFQVKLYETTNVIEFLYGSVVPGSHNALESASIGIKDGLGGAGHFIEATQNSTNIILAILKSENNWPLVNYRFSPPIVPEMDTFYKIVVSKPTGKLSIGRDVMVTGMN